LHLLLDRRRFCRHPSVTAPSTGAVDATTALGRPPCLLPGCRSGSRLSFGSFVPALDSWAKSPLSIKGRLSSRTGEVTLSFGSAFLSSTEAVDAFASLPLPVTSPAELRLASSLPRISFFGLAGDRSPFPLNAVAPAQSATKLLLLPNFASPALPGMGLPISLESCIPQLAPRGESPTSFGPSSSCVAGNLCRLAPCGLNRQILVSNRFCRQPAPGPGPASVRSA